MPLRCGDMAPNPDVLGRGGPQPLLSRDGRTWSLLWFGPEGAPAPAGWDALRERAGCAASPWLRLARVRIAAHPPPEGLADPGGEAHQRYDAFDWRSHRPVSTLVLVDPWAIVRLAQSGDPPDLTDVFKILDRKEIPGDQP